VLFGFLTDAADSILSMEDRVAEDEEVRSPAAGGANPASAAEIRTLF
jgi:hypothetical protein